MSSDPAARRGRLRGILLDVEPLRRDRDFRFLWAGQLISGVGRQVTVVALPFQLYILTGSTLAVAVILEGGVEIPIARESLHVDAP